VVVGEPPALFTGYFEPELDGSPVRSGRFSIRSTPPARTARRRAYHTRAAIESGAIAGRGLEIAWLDDPVDVYFLQVQGSGRIRMTDGTVVRVGYAGARTAMPTGPSGRKWSAAAPIRWTRSRRRRSPYVRTNPAAGRDLLDTNPSYVFFRKIGTLEPEGRPDRRHGPVDHHDALGRHRPEVHPLGAPVWIEKDGRRPIRSLMVAQDTGGAIKGMQRADIFYGTGKGAGDAAGTVKDPGRMVLLLPIDRAFAMLEDD
jgi:membrane-bound lytic murein transglycosylase A